MIETIGRHRNDCPCDACRDSRGPIDPRDAAVNAVWEQVQHLRSPRLMVRLACRIGWEAAEADAAGMLARAAAEFEREDAEAVRTLWGDAGAGE